MIPASGVDGVGARARRGSFLANVSLPEDKRLVIAPTILPNRYIKRMQSPKTVTIPNDTVIAGTATVPTTNSICGPLITINVARIARKAITLALETL